MKLHIATTFTTAIVVFLPTTFACLEISGAMSTSSPGNPPVIEFMTTIDDSVTTCNADWGWHVGDLGVAISCISGYYGVSFDATLGYYSNPSNNYETGQQPAGYGATLSWNKSVFGC